MTPKVGLLFFLLLLVCCNFSHGKLRIKARIVSGRNASEGQFPFYVLLKSPGVEGGGSLISKDWVLTAAHVVATVEYITLVFGVTKLFDKKSISMKSRNIYAHPGFIPGVMTYDIALIKLPESLTFNEHISPVSLPTFSMANETFVGTKITVVGFGYLSDKYPREKPDNLQFAKLTVIRKAECEEELMKNISDVVVCAKAVSTEATCNGDSGGPAVRQDENGDFMQIGIISFSYDRRCELPLPMGLTRITSFLEWINEATGLVKP